MKQLERPLPLVSGKINGAVGELCLKRPQKRNAINDDMAEQIITLCGWFDQSDTVKVVVLRGSGDAFCAGMDIELFRSGNRRAVEASAELTRQMMERIAAMKPVVIAAMHGSCVGASAILLATACDLRYAANDTRFFLPEIDLGIPVSYSGMAALAKSLGPALTLEMAILGQQVSPETLDQKHFLNGLFRPELLFDEVNGIAARLARNPRLVLRMTKAQMAYENRTLASPHHSFQFMSDLRLTLKDSECISARKAYLARVGWNGAQAPGARPTP